MLYNQQIDVSLASGLSDGNILYFVAHKGTTFPTVPSPVAGQFFYRTDLEKIYVHDGTIWTEAGISGYSGYSGISGYSGATGTGTSGYSGAATSGYSGWSGISGYSADSGISGWSGYSGISGYSGEIGTGTSGYSGYGASGWSGISGYSGISGFSGDSGISGWSGYGTSGYSGYGTSGYSGISGYSGSGGGGGSYGTTFTNASLSSGLLTVTHSLSNQYNQVAVYDNNDQLVFPDEITATSTSVVTLDLTTFGTLTGTWKVRVTP